MDKKIEIINRLILDLLPKITEYLDPNQAQSAKLSVLSKVFRMRGQATKAGYPKTERILGECMLHYGTELGTASSCGCALKDMGQSFKKMAQVRHTLDTNVKQSFINPLQRLKENEEIEGDLMQHLLGLTEAILDYHRQSGIIVEDLRSSLKNRMTEASNKPDTEIKSTPVASRQSHRDFYEYPSWPTEPSSGTGNRDTHFDQPCCMALYSFTSENQGDLSFKAGDIIILTNRPDENWYEGMINEEIGFFPASYVEVLMPLPQ